MATRRRVRHQHFAAPRTDEEHFLGNLTSADNVVPWALPTTTTSRGGESPCKSISAYRSPATWHVHPCFEVFKYFENDVEITVFEEWDRQHKSPILHENAQVQGTAIQKADQQITAPLRSSNKKSYHEDVDFFLERL